MSRSYKKVPVSTDGKRKTTKEMKRCANKHVRHYKEGLHKGNAYKKLFCSYDIHDFISYWPWSEAKQDYETGMLSSYLQERYPTLKSFYRHWYTCQKRK